MTKKKIDEEWTGAEPKAKRVRASKVTPTMDELMEQRDANRQATKEVLQRVRRLAAVHKLTVPDKMTTLAAANDLLGQITDVACGDRYVFHVMLEINMPSQSDNGVVIREGYPLTLSYMFDNYPDAFAIEQALRKDDFIRAHPQYALMAQIISFCLETWGVPNLPTSANKMYGEHSSMECTSVRTAWLANVMEKEAATFNQQFGSIFITRKSVNYGSLQ